MTPLDGIISQLIKTSEELENEIKILSKEEHIFGLISEKYIKCGKKNCKCTQGKAYHHGPYYYLRREPKYNYREYLGKTVPFDVESKIDLWKKIRYLERKKKKIEKTLDKLGKFLIVG